MEPKERYRDLCESEPTIPVFCQAWWMDVVCGEDNWDVLVVEKQEKIVGALPYCITKGLLGLPQIVMPQQTHYSGIWIKYPPEQNHIKRLSYEKGIMDAIILEIDKLNIAYFSLHFPYTVTNWLPFLWKGFQQTTRYSYVIEDLSDLEKVFNQFENSKRRWIHKAERTVTVKHDLPTSIFYQLHQKDLESIGLKINYSYDLLDEMVKKAYDKDKGKIIYCEDGNGNICGAHFIIWDSMSAYSLLGGCDPDFKDRGINEMLYFESIKYASTRTKQFDFEGSVIESYERSYRSYGGIQKPYFNIRKTYSPIYMIHDGLNQIMKGMKQEIKSIISRHHNR